LSVSALAAPAKNVVAMTANAVVLRKLRKIPPRGRSPSQKTDDADRAVFVKPDFLLEPR
jgi:hypothetical protein